MSEPPSSRGFPPRSATSLVAALLVAGMCLFVIMAVSGALLAISRRQAPPDIESQTAVLAEILPTASPLILLLPPPSPGSTAPAQVATPIPPTPVPSSTSPPAPATAPTEAASEGCPHPDGWELHSVQPGETLFAYVLGAGGSITTDQLREANCLSSDLLLIGQSLYLPAGAAENAPPSEPFAAPAAAVTGPRTPACTPNCTITIQPGWRAEQIAQAIDAAPVGFWGADFLAAIGAGAAIPSYPFLASKPSDRSLEGYLYPGTYELTNATTPGEFRDMLLAAFAANYTPDMEAAAATRNLTFYQALTLASIIQRESWSYDEQLLVSSVFHNRLAGGNKLGATVTTQYILGGPGNWWPRLTGGQINIPSPYNTNINAGLPPSPIASPAIGAIRAALTPADTSYQFFTGNCRGPGNLYATTYEEHLANVNSCS